MMPPSSTGLAATGLAPDWFQRCRLKLRHLQLFAALDAHRNLHRTAASLGITQPAASKLLCEMEAALGRRLFERQPRGLEPNGDGEIMIRRARMILSELDGARAELDARQAGDAGMVAVGTVDTPALGILATAIRAVQARQPRMQIHVRNATSDELTREILAGTLDFALARPVTGPGQQAIDYLPIEAETLSLICRPGHALLSRGVMPLADLVDASWVLPPNGGLARQLLDSLFRQAGLAPPSCVVNTRSIMMTLNLVADSDALGCLSLAVSERYAALGQIALLPVRAKLEVQPYGIVRLHGRLLSPAARLMLDAVMAAARPHARAA